MKYFVAGLLFFFQAERTWSQVVASKTQLDSLTQALSTATSDTQRVYLYIQLAKVAPNKSAIINYGRQGLALARHIQFDKGAIQCGLLVGNNLVELDYYSAVPILLETKQLCEKQKDARTMAKVLGSLGYAYNKFDYQKAHNYYTACQQWMQKNKLSEYVFPITTSLGQFYKNWGKSDSALYYLQKGYQIALKTNIPLPPEGFYVPFGIVYYQKKQFKLAMDYFRRSIARTNLFYGQAHQGIALIYRDQKQLDSARVYAQKALAFEQKDNKIIYIIQDADLLFDLYKNIDPAQALHYHLIASAAKDSLFKQEKVRQTEKVAYEEQEREERTKRRIEANRVAYQNRIRLYSILVVLGATLLGAFFLYRNNRQKQKANALLNEQKQKVEQMLLELKATQTQLIQKEKLASLGELTAGIAHEIQNPLNFVNNFSELSTELLEELADELPQELKTPPLGVGGLLLDLTQNLQKINHHGKRASSIVKGMLEHSRMGTGERVLTDLNALCDEYLRLSYHGMRAKNNQFNADFELITDPNLPKVNVVSQDIGRVLLNLINNAFQSPPPPEGGVSYRKKVIVKTFFEANKQSPHWGFGGFLVSDNGAGIPADILPKIFQPFFTTKPTGEGTGLGLSLSYDIITKGHGGRLEVESVEGEGATFIISLPIM
ncbi:MAG: ATP-binding protein [Spirosomataceae bacterium]